MFKKFLTTSLLLTTFSLTALSAQNSTPVNNESFLKNQISNLKIAFAGPFSIRSLELENRLLGAYLPLSENTILEFEEAAAKLYDETYETCQDKKVPAILRSQFLNLVKYSLEQLT